MKKEKPRYRKRSLSSRIKNCLSGAVIGLGLMLSSNANAEPPSWHTQRSAPEYRSMGKAGDLTSDPHIPSNAVMEKSKRNITFSFRANPGDLADAPDEIGELIDFEYMRDKSIPLAERLNMLIGRVNRFDADLKLDMTLDSYLTFGKGSSRYVAGAYGSFYFRTEMRGIKDLGFNDLRFDEDPYLDLGEPKEILDSRALIRTGAYFGYAKRYRIRKSFLSWGVRGTAVYTSYKPIAYAKLNQIIRGIDDISTEKDNKRNGGGILLDAHSTAHLNDFLFNTRLAVGITNFGALWYKKGIEDAHAPGFSAGIALHPFHALNHDNLLIAFDAENIGTGMTELQTGMSYRIGSERLAVTPKVGLIINEPELFTRARQNIFTSGASLDAGGMRITGGMEYNITKGTMMYNIGIGGDF